MEHKDPKELFEKYKAGILTEEERSIIESWYLQASKEKNIQIEEGDLGNVDAFWRRFQEAGKNDLLTEAHPERTIPLQGWLVAASVSIICVLGLLYYYSDGNLFSGRAIPAILYHQTANAEVKQIELPDGTHVWLNAGSSLVHPEHFNGRERLVELEGEAYFEVAHDPEQPFVISTGEFRTTVLGTSFNVSAYPDDTHFEVAVLTGKVGVLFGGGQVSNETTNAFVSAKERIRYNRLSDDFKSYEDKNIGEAIAWRQGRLIFRNTPLAEVIPDLQRAYNIRLTANPEILRCSIFLELNNEPLEKVLKVLAELVNGKVVQKADTYHLVGKPCKTN